MLAQRSVQLQRLRPEPVSQRDLLQRLPELGISGSRHTKAQILRQTQIEQIKLLRQITNHTGSTAAVVLLPAKQTAALQRRQMTGQSFQQTAFTATGRAGDQQNVSGLQFQIKTARAGMYHLQLLQGQQRCKLLWLHS